MTVDSKYQQALLDDFLKTAVANVWLVGLATATTESGVAVKGSGTGLAGTIANSTGLAGTVTNG